MTSMQATFACPECGAELKSSRVGSARRIVCDRCLTLVEVPFFPRTRTRYTQPRRWARRFMWSGVTLIVLMAAAIGFGALVRSLDRPAQRRTAYKFPYFSRSEAESQLSSIESSEATDPSRAVQEYLALLDRVRADESLGDLADRIRERLPQIRLRSAEADLSGARAALAAEPNRALALCERATRTVEDLPPGRGIQLR